MRVATASILLTAGLGAACSGRATEPAARTPPRRDAVVASPAERTTARRPALAARFEPPPTFATTTQGAELAFVVENRSTSPATIDIDVLSSAIFALEFSDAGGRRVLTIPPGVPPRDYQPRREVLAPGARRRFECDLNVFSPPLPRGTYSARLAASTAIASKPVRFVVSPGGP